MPNNNHTPLFFKKSSKILRILLLSIFFLTVSCSTSDEDGDTQEDIFNYILFYMNYPNGIAFGSYSETISIFLNDEGVISRRTGGIYDGNLDDAVGFSYFYDDLISDEVTYDENKIFVEKLSNNPEIDIPIFKRTFLLDENNNISQKITETSDPVKTDTLDFEYDLNGKISKILYRGMTIPKESSFYFNNNENLDSIVTIEYNEELDTTIKTLERFENYDSAENPIKELFIFEELFYRSLSKNNYSLYWYEVFTTKPSSSSFSSTYKEWNLKYDSDGNVKFDEL